MQRNAGCGGGITIFDGDVPAAGPLAQHVLDRRRHRRARLASTDNPNAAIPRQVIRSVAHAQHIAFAPQRTPHGRTRLDSVQRRTEHIEHCLPASVAGDDRPI